VRHPSRTYMLLPFTAAHSGTRESLLADTALDSRAAGTLDSCMAKKRRLLEPATSHLPASSQRTVTWHLTPGGRREVDESNTEEARNASQDGSKQTRTRTCTGSAEHSQQQRSINTIQTRCTSHERRPQGNHSVGKLPGNHVCSEWLLPHSFLQIPRCFRCHVCDITHS
jgi:hypothetical protein